MTSVLSDQYTRIKEMFDRIRRALRKCGAFAMELLVNEDKGAIQKTRRPGRIDPSPNERAPLRSNFSINSAAITERDYRE